MVGAAFAIAFDILREGFPVAGTCGGVLDGKDERSFTPSARPFPEWLKVRVPDDATAHRTRKILEDLGLNTVCHHAVCPNLGHCFARSTATFLIMGDTCTRNCRFCAVGKGRPAPLDDTEPDRVAEAAKALGLKHVVVTSVTRDDIPDGGAEHFAKTVKAIKAKVPGATVEVLTPDFLGSVESIYTVVDSGPDVYNHNLETVPDLYERVRPKADYRRSLEVLRTAKARARARGQRMFTKSGLMLGLGETEEQVIKVMEDLRAAECDVLTLGQYLRPSKDHLPVVEYVHPDRFVALGEKARAMGFLHVASAPLVRSSFHADEFQELARGEGRALAGASGAWAASSEPAASDDHAGRLSSTSGPSCGRRL